MLCRDRENRARRDGCVDGIATGPQGCDAGVGG
jgi:hypothetical protein